MRTFQSASCCSKLNVGIKIEVADKQTVNKGAIGTSSKPIIIDDEVDFDVNRDTSQAHQVHANTKDSNPPNQG